MCGCVVVVGQDNGFIVGLDGAFEVMSCCVFSLARVWLLEGDYILPH